MKNRKYILAFLCLSVILGSFLMGCVKEDDESDASGVKSYSINVKTEGNMPLTEIGVCVYEDSNLDDILCIKETDETGNVTFDAEKKDKYVVVLKDIPQGYNVKDYYEIKNETTEIVLEAELLPIENLSETIFKKGDVIKDFSVTATDGTVCTISELLQEKKAVILNFWYLTCDPCKMEFPYLQEAYEQYSDDIAIIAMDPLNKENDDIAEYKENLGITFYMAPCSSDWEKAMQLTAYPTTVIIDRYGVISLIHRGKFDDSESVKAIFEYYTSDEYTQTIVKDIDDITQRK